MSFPLTDSLRDFRSTHRRTSPERFGMITIPAHQDVGSLTFDITPNDSISSFLTLSRSGIGTFLGVNSARGVASFFRLIKYGSPKFPSPVNTLGNSRLTSLSELYVSSSFCTSCRAVRAGRPSKSFFNPLTMKITS